MLKLRNFSIAILSIIITGCASTTVPFASKHENTWFLEDRGGRVFPIYCMANKKENSASPKCFEAKKLELKGDW